MTLSLAYAFTLAWRFNKELFTKRFNHTVVVFFSGNNTIKHINRHFIGTQTVKTEKISKMRPEVSSVLLLVLCTRGGGVLGRMSASYT